MARSERPDQRGGAARDAYRGELGRTRSEPHPVCMHDGSQRVLNLHVSIDAAHDPALAALARHGTLHVLEDGGELALPFTYHDPRSAVFVLVVPLSLRHRVLKLRAELLLALAEDPTSDIPDYVAMAEVVLGAEGLRDRLATDPDDETFDSYPEDERDDDERERDELDDEQDELDVDDAEYDEFGTRASDVTELLDDASGLFSLDEAPQQAPGAVTSVNRRGVDFDALSHAEARAVTAALASVNPPVNPTAGDSDYARSSDIEALDGPLVPPLAGFARDDEHAWLLEDDGRVWLYVRGRPRDQRAHGELDVLIQRDARSLSSLFVLSVVFDVAGSPEVRRGIVDPHSDNDRRALQRLAETFELELVAVSPEGQAHWGTLYAPREANVSALLAWAAAREPVPGHELDRASQRLLESPPAWRDQHQPFQQNSRPSLPGSATEAAVALDELTVWLTPERIDHLRMDLSVPDELVDLRCREVLANALDFGLALDPALTARALALGVAPHARGLLERRVVGLCRTSAEHDLGGLSEDVLRTLWAELLQQASLLDIALSPAAEAQALRHAGERALGHARALARHDDDDALAALRLRFSVGERDPDLLRTLITRGGLRDVVDVVRAAAAEGDQTLARTFACLSMRADVAAIDAAQALLASGDTAHVRVGAALTLAVHRSISAIPELVRRVAGEEAEARAISWALGRYGAGSFRAVVRALSEQRVPPEREAWVLAALVHHGARAQVRARGRSHIATEAQLAERALELANSLKETGNPFTGLEQQGTLTVFFEVFDKARHAAAGGLHGVVRAVDSAALVP